MTETDHALLRLLLAGGPSAPRRTLLERHACPLAARDVGPSAWRDAGLNADQGRALAAQAPLPGHVLAWLEAPGHHLLGWHSPDYPALLRRIQNPPLALFVAGDPSRLWHPAVAIVGSRNPSSGGLDHARHFARSLARGGLGICSGLAAGIDTAAHGATLAAGGLTVAVLGSGIDVPYPAANAGLAARIADDGALVSEHPPGTRPCREHFPARNRIIAGLSLGTLVVEAAARSGALITARLSSEAGREVFAVPGSILNPMARGCHRLIRDGATLVEQPEEVVAALAPVAEALAEALRSRLQTPISKAVSISRTTAEALNPETPDYQRLWSALGHDPSSMDHLAERTGLTPADLSSMLLLMELDGRVVLEHGRYSRTSCHTAPQAQAGGK